MRLGLAVVVCGLVGLTGCSGGVLGGSDGESGGALAGARLTGSVHGGQQPIVGAHVYLFAAGTTGYGGAGIAASSGNASVSLLTSAGNTALDSSGGATNGDYYVTTDGSGGFSIGGDYTCAAGAQVYLYALGGNPWSGVNSAAGLMAALGNCPALGNFASATPYIVVNEVSTVAAAYAMAGFATDATHVGSSGTSLASMGIANAFANAGNLVTLSTGAALASTPAGNGTVPQAEINTLANVLASCVNSSTASSTTCTTLFANAESGGSSGTVAADTATAAINVAHNPGTNVAALYGLSTSNPPFGTALTAQPNDWTVALTFTGGGLYDPVSIAIDGSGNAWTSNPNNGLVQSNGVTEFSSSGAILSGTYGFTAGSWIHGLADIAIDRSGNAWVADDSDRSIIKLSSSGSILSGVNGFSGGGIYEGGPQAIAIDAFDNAWIANEVGQSVTELSSSGSVLSGANGFTGGAFGGPYSIAIDGSGNAWIANTTWPSVTKLSSSGSILSGTNGYTGGGISHPHGIAIDASGNAWIANNGSASVTKLSGSGSILSGTKGYTGGGLSLPSGIAIDGSGNAWIANSSGQGITELSNLGSVLSGANGYTGGGLGFSGAIAIDGSGNAWVTYYDFVSEFVGVATPVITPIAAGLPATPTADGSSRLGTRP